MGHAGGGQTPDISLLFCISRVVRVQMRISIWNPAPRRHRADKASLGRLDRIIESPLALQSPSLRPEPGAGKCLSLTLCLCISASVCVLHSNPPTFNVSLLQQDRRKRKGCLTLLTTPSKRMKILFPQVLTSAPTATLPISLSSPCARCGALRPPKHPNPQAAQRPLEPRGVSDRTARSNPVQYSKHRPPHHHRRLFQSPPFFFLDLERVRVNVDVLSFLASLTSNHPSIQIRIAFIRLYNTIH